MSRVRWWAMYLLSSAVGYSTAGLLMALGWRWTKPVSQLVRGQATEHADAAREMTGPYMAPVMFVAALALVTLAGIGIVRVLS